MLRRVVLISDLAVERDGPTAVAMSAVRTLRKNGIAVTYVCGDDGQNAELADLGVQIVPVRGQNRQGERRVAISGLYNAGRQALGTIGGGLRRSYCLS